MHTVTRIALFAAFLLPLSGLGAQQRVAHASGDCGDATPFTTRVSGTLDAEESSDWWETQSTGVAIVTVQTDRPDSVYLNVFSHGAGECDALCVNGPSPTPTRQCVVHFTGSIQIDVMHFIGTGETINYDLTVVTAPSMPSTDACNVVDVAGVCLDLQVGAALQDVAIVPGVIDGASTHHVGGRVDLYQFALPGGASATVPCVVVSVGGTSVDGCASAGGTFVSTLATLLDAEETPPALGGSAATIRLCNARLSATIAGIGVQNVPAVGVC